MNLEDVYTDDLIDEIESRGYTISKNYKIKQDKIVDIYDKYQLKEFLTDLFNLSHVIDNDVLINDIKQHLNMKHDDIVLTIKIGDKSFNAKMSANEQESLQIHNVSALDVLYDLIKSEITNKQNK